MATTQTRTFHTDVTAGYALPNDSPEHQRLEDQAKYLATIMNDQVVHAPVDVEKASHILDVGCGTGYVTDTLAQLFPQAQVYGLDLSPVPDLRPLRPNMTFLRGNIMTQTPTAWAIQRGSQGPLSQETSQFNLIFSRFLLAGMTDWPAYLSTVYTLLKPGAHAELHELSVTVYDASESVISTSWPWHTATSAYFSARGFDFTVGENLEQYVTDAGFVDVQVKKHATYLGPRSGDAPAEREASAFFSRDITEAYETLLSAAWSGHGAEVVEERKADARRAFAPEEGKHVWLYEVVGKKPV